MTATKYRLEVRTLDAEVVDLASKFSTTATIPLPRNVYMSDVIEAKEILDDVAWEVVGFDNGMIAFKRLVEGSYAI